MTRSSLCSLTLKAILKWTALPPWNGTVSLIGVSSSHDGFPPRNSKEEVISQKRTKRIGTSGVQVFQDPSLPLFSTYCYPLIFYADVFRLKSDIDCCTNSLYLGIGLSGNNKLFRLGCSFSHPRMIVSWFGANACQFRLTTFKTEKNLTLIPHLRMILNIKNIYIF